MAVQALIGQPCQNPGALSPTGVLMAASTSCGGNGSDTGNCGDGSGNDLSCSALAFPPFSCLNTPSRPLIAGMNGFLGFPLSRTHLFKLHTQLPLDSIPGISRGLPSLFDSFGLVDSCFSVLCVEARYEPA